MAIFLDRIDTFTTAADSNFSNQYCSWLAVTIDTLNSSLQTIQDSFNLLTGQSYTSAQINTFFTNGDLSDGVILYDTTNNVYVGMISGVLVKFTTTPYP